MKKLLVLVSTFVLLTGFNCKKVKELDIQFIPMNILLQTLPPRIDAVIPGTEIYAKEGENKEFKVTYTSTPKAQVAVLKGNSSFLDENCTVTFNSTTVIVKITNIKMENAGIYTVTLSNDAGASLVYIKLYVAKDIQQ